MIICVGEILVDIFEIENSCGIIYEKKCGGAPFNVASSIKRLGGKCGFYGAIGNDDNGKMLLDYVNNAGFDYSKIDITDKMTTYTLVKTGLNGERSFSFFRNDSSDYNFDPKSIDELIKSASICHLGSLMLSEEQGRNFADILIKKCKEKNIKISFDVNYRASVFNDSTEAKEILLKYAKMVDIIKLSEEELEFLSGESNIKSGIEKLFDNKLVYVTMGEKGSIVYTNGKLITASPLKVTPVDTTGAGDAFFGGVLYELEQKSNIEKTLVTGNICGAITCTKKGAINCFDNYSQVKKFFNEIKVKYE